MRDSAANLEKLLTTLHQEVIMDRSFLAGMLDHKNATLAWLRDRQRTDVEALNKLYDDMINTFFQEVELLEKHIATYDQVETHGRN